MKKALLVSYVFPPTGGSGVQRVAKFAKFLPQSGWDVTVLTAANPSVPLVDGSLMGDVPADTLICRAKTLEPSYSIKSKLAESDGIPGDSRSRSPRAWVTAGLRRAANLVLQPDPQILWKHHAVRAGLRILRESPHDVIFASAPPFSTLLIAREISRRSGVPLVVDYRDEWGLSNRYWENKRPDRISTLIQERMQRAVLRSSAAVVATTQASASNLRDECRRCHSSARVECIFNGFDADDFASTSHDRPLSASDGLIRLAYVGTLWTLTTIKPIVRALVALAESSAGDLANFRLVVAGRRTPAEKTILQELEPLGPIVEEHDYVDHSAAVSLMSAADELCITLADVPGADRVLPAKVFEYLAVGRPILGVAPRGDLWRLLERFPQSRAFEPGDIHGIAKHLLKSIRSSSSPTTEPANHSPIAEFERVNQTRQLAEILSAAASRRS